MSSDNTTNTTTHKPFNFSEVANKALRSGFSGSMAMAI